MELKLILGIIAAAFTVSAFFPYLSSVLKKRTKPHAYSWLIWMITVGTAAFATWHGGGGFGALSLAAGALFSLFIFVLSFRYGTKNITKGDTATLLAALLAIVIWWQLENPLLAVFMVSAIDGAGYLPTYRKSWHEPWSEDLRAWVLGILSNIFALFALTEYNLLTATYLAVLLSANILLVSLCMFRRRALRKPLDQ